MPWGLTRPYPLIMMAPADPQDWSPPPAGVISDADHDPVRPAERTVRGRVVDAVDHADAETARCAGGFFGDEAVPGEPVVLCSGGSLTW
jgi:hypothetical protein